MIIDVLTKDFAKMDIRNKKKVLKKFFGHKIDEIVWGGLTNCSCGEYKIRHEGCAYSRIKVTTTDNGYMNITIYNYQTKEWQDKDN